VWATRRRLILATWHRVVGYKINQPGAGEDILFWPVAKSHRDQQVVSIRNCRSQCRSGPPGRVDLRPTCAMVSTLRAGREGNCSGRTEKTRGTADLETGLIILVDTSGGLTIGLTGTCPSRRRYGWRHRFLSIFRVFSFILWGQMTPGRSVLHDVHAKLQLWHIVPTFEVLHWKFRSRVGQTNAQRPLGNTYGTDIQFTDGDSHLPRVTKQQRSEQVTRGCAYVRASRKGPASARNSHYRHVHQVHAKNAGCNVVSFFDKYSILISKR
jgi:hypothetical protein